MRKTALSIFATALLAAGRMAPAGEILIPAETEFEKCRRSVSSKTAETDNYQEAKCPAGTPDAPRTLMVRCEPDPDKKGQMPWLTVSSHDQGDYLRHRNVPQKIIVCRTSAEPL